MADRLRADDGGAVADYIPQLKRVDPDKFGIGVCTVDGQRFTIGDTGDLFCVQSMCKPLNYSLAPEEHGVAEAHRHVGREPSGRGFNELSLSADGLPHNSMINSGAIMCCSLLRSHDELADRFDHVATTWRKLSAYHRVGFNNSV
jgi:glutaminase